MELKAGDKVRCVDKKYWYEDIAVGREYLVTQVIPMLNRVVIHDDVCMSCDYSADRFEKVEEE